MSAGMKWGRGDILRDGFSEWSKDNLHGDITRFCPTGSWEIVAVFLATWWRRRTERHWFQFCKGVVRAEFPAGIFLYDLEGKQTGNALGVVVIKLPGLHIRLTTSSSLQHSTVDADCSTSKKLHKHWSPEKIKPTPLFECRWTLGSLVGSLVFIWYGSGRISSLLLTNTSSPRWPASLRPSCQT